MAEQLAIEHLLVRLAPVNAALRAAIERQSAFVRWLQKSESDVSGICVTPAHAERLMDDCERATQPQRTGEPNIGEESPAERDVRERARRSGYTLPLDQLQREMHLDNFEMEALLICMTTTIDRRYERLIGYVLDDLTRRFPCVELVCGLTAQSTQESLARRPIVGRYGKLRRAGVIEAFGEQTTELRTNLRPSVAIADFLLGSGADAIGLFRDWADVQTVAQPALHADNPALAQLAAALAERKVSAVGIWGPPEASPDEAAAVVAQRAERPLRDLLREIGATANSAGVRDAVRAAALSSAILLVRVDTLHEPEQATLREEIASVLSASSTPIILVGERPWRPTRLLASRAYVQVTLAMPSLERRQAAWAAALPDADSTKRDELAAQHHLSGLELTAIAMTTAAQAAVPLVAARDQKAHPLESAAQVILNKASGRFVTPVVPRRTERDLILPAPLKKQVMELADFARILPRVNELWGFGRLSTGGSGNKALFTGDPGTGKTLAAEVVAQALNVSLLKVNLAETLSKWVGECEKNLDEAFREASASHSILYIDEADGLCSKRGEVSRGSDRYANLEVSYLLQRLEDHSGTVILSSNLKDNIDPAFMRRFHVVLHFPRPTPQDRLSIWELALRDAPRGGDLNLAGVSQVDLTGAGIVGAARTAALLAAKENAAEISMRHVIEGISRQFQREARVLSPGDLGAYGTLLTQKR